MLRPRLIVALAAILLCLLSSAADARSFTITFDVRDPATGKPAAGVKVEVSDFDGKKLGSGVTGADGKATITVEMPEGDTFVMETDAQGRKGVSMVETGNMSKRFTVTTGIGSRFDHNSDGLEGFSSDIRDLVYRAAKRCDKAAYDRWVSELDQEISSAQSKIDQRQRDADAFARDRNLRITDLDGAQKDLRRATAAQEKVDPAIRNTQLLKDLDTYIDMLTIVSGTKLILKELQDIRRELEPFPEDCKKDKVGLVPGVKTCPDGSGGLLAGGLNELFDTDLDPACETVSNRRDTDRPKKDREHREHRRD